MHLDSSFRKRHLHFILGCIIDFILGFIIGGYLVFTFNCFRIESENVSYRLEKAIYQSHPTTLCF